MADTDKVRIQKITFTNWCNHHLEGIGTKIDDLVTDLEDGVKLVDLLEILAKRKIPDKIHRKPETPEQRLHNLAMALDFIKDEEKISIGNIRPHHIIYHDQVQILNLIWQLICKYQILGGGMQEPTELSSAKIFLLNWLQAAMPDDLPVQNLESDWNNAKCLSALVEMMKPGTIPNFRSLRPEDSLSETHRAMHLAMEMFGIPQILKPEHMCMNKPDEFSMMTYLSYFCSGNDSPGYKALLAWVQSTIPEYNIKNLTDDWRDGQALSALVNAIAKNSLPGHASLDPNKGLENVRVAMKTASDLEGVKNSIRPEVFVNKHTCTLAMMSYIARFCKANSLSQDHPKPVAERKGKTSEPAPGKGLRNPFRKFRSPNPKQQLTVGPVLAQLFSDNLMTRKDRERLTDISEVIVVQSSKPRVVVDRTVIIMKSFGFVKESEVLSVIIDLQEGNLITHQECREACEGGKRMRHASDVVGVQSSKSLGVIAATAEVLKRHGLDGESRLLSVIADLQRRDLITSEECKKEASKAGKGLSLASDVCRVQSGKLLDVIVKTADVLLRYGFEKESRILSVHKLFDELLHNDLITDREKEQLADFSDVVRVQTGKSTEAMLKTSETLRKHGYMEELKVFSVCAVLTELLRAHLITGKERKRVTDVSDIVRVQRVKPQEVLVKTATVLERYGLKNESTFLAVVAKLAQEHLITREEKERLNDPSDVVRVQRAKPPEVLAKTAAIVADLKVEEFKFLVVLAKLQQVNVITSEECKGMNYASDMVRIQHFKSEKVMLTTADHLNTSGFVQESRFLSVLAQLVQAGLSHENGYKILWDHSCLVSVLSHHPNMVATADGIFRSNEFHLEKEFKVLKVLTELRQLDLISSEESEVLANLDGLVKVQSTKTSGIVAETAQVLRTHGFAKESDDLTDAIFLTKHPTMEQLTELVVPRVTSEWPQVGTMLGMSPKQLEEIESSKRQEYCCATMFGEWLNRAKGTRYKKRSWKLVLAAVESIDSLAAKEIRKELRQWIESQLHSDTKTATKDQTQDLHTGEALLTFEERYAEVVRSQAIVKMKITKCTTIGPPRKGKTCLKHLLTGHQWDGGTTSTDVMEAPEWVECYNEEERGAEELWKLVPQKEQRNKVIRAVITIPTTIPGAPTRAVSGASLTNAVSGTQPATTVSGLPSTATVIGTPPTTPVTGTPSTTTVSGNPPTPAIPDAPPMTPVTGAPLTTIVSGNPPTHTITGAPPMPPVTGAPPTTIVSGVPPTPTIMGVLPKTPVTGAPLTTIVSGNQHTPASTDAQPTATVSCPRQASTTSDSGLRDGTLLQGVQALASALSREELIDFLKDKEGKVLGETQLIHFIDTGGQAIYHDIHPILITSPSVYLVVFSLKDFYGKDDDQQRDYFKSNGIQRPLESVCAFGTKTPQDRGHLEFHPAAPKIFIVGTHLDQIPQGDSRKHFLQEIDKMIQDEIKNKSYRQFVQFDTEGKSFWAVDNTLAGREQDEDDMKYISTLRRMVQDKSMEMSVKIPLTWMLLKVIMEGQGEHYYKYSVLLHEARKRGYVREDSPDSDLDTMLNLFHILSLFYHKVPKGSRKEDSLVFIDPGCLFSATSDFLMAAKEEIEDRQGSYEENQHPFQPVTSKEELAVKGSTQQKQGQENIVEKQMVIQRIDGNAEIIRQKLEAELRTVVSATDLELGPLSTQLKESGKRYDERAYTECPEASSVKAKRHLFVGRLVHSLANSVAVLHASDRKGDAQYVKEELVKAVNNVRARYESRTIKSHDIDQVLSILVDLRIVARANLDSYVVPAALPNRNYSRKVVRSAGLRGHAAPIFVTLLSQTIIKVCYLPSCLYCCLINELVTRLGWTVIPLERTHVAFTHVSFTGTVHMMEHQSYIEIKLESERSEASLDDLPQSCQTVRESLHDSIVHVYVNLYSCPTADAVLKQSLVWGFECMGHPGDDTHIAAFREDEEEGCWTECLQSLDQQDIKEEQIVWF